jgi:hypothetical protein
MARHNSEPRVCRRVSSSTYFQHSLLDSSSCYSTLVAALDKPQEFSSTTSRAWCASASLPSRNATLRARSSASPQAEASAEAPSASILDTRSRASLSTRVVQAFASLTRAAALSRAVAASWVEASTTCTTSTRWPPMPRLPAPMLWARQ